MTFYETTIKSTVDADPQVLSLKAKVEKLEAELLNAKGQLANAKTAAINRALNEKK